MDDAQAMDADLDRAAELLAGARSVVALTGAGISAESGVPTFRDALTGLWAKYDPAELATPEAFARQPRLVARWYDQRRMKCAACEPNAGHLALAAIERVVIAAGGSFTLLTQNVDRLHHRAGSGDPVELHGNLFVWRCTKTGEETEPPLERFAEYPPLSAAGHPMRPGIVWFGEALPAEAIERAEAATAACDLFLSIGTSAVVWPAAGFLHAAREAGARAIEVNAEPTQATGTVDVALHGPAGRVLPELARRAFGEGFARGADSPSPGAR